MSDRYKIFDQNAVYFMTLTIVDWIEVFTSKEQKHMIVNALKYCQKEKGLEIYGWCLMPSHLHLICSVSSEIGMSSFLRDFKKFTSKEIVKLVNKMPESQREWTLKQFEKACKYLKRDQKYKVWQDSNQAKIILSANFFYQKLKYIHDNPVEEMLVTNPEDYMFSSARNYADLNYLLEVIVEPQQLITVK